MARAASGLETGVAGCLDSGGSASRAQVRGAYVCMCAVCCMHVTEFGQEFVRVALQVCVYLSTPEVRVCGYVLHEQPGLPKCVCPVRMSDPPGVCVCMSRCHWWVLSLAYVASELDACYFELVGDAGLAQDRVLPGVRTRGPL